jgi:hypothetical protein
MGRHDSTADGPPATSRDRAGHRGPPADRAASVLVAGLMSGCDESRLDRWHFPL